MTHGWQNLGSNGPKGGWGSGSLCLSRSFPFSFHVFLFLSICLLVYLFIYLSDDQFESLSIYLSIPLSLSLFLSIYVIYLASYSQLSIHLSLGLSICPPAISHFDLEMRFVPQRRALFPLPNFQKFSDAGVFLPFWLPHVLRASSRHNGVQFFILHPTRWLRARRFGEPPEPQNIGKTLCLATVLPFCALWSSSFWLLLFWLFLFYDSSHHCCCICQ